MPCSKFGSSPSPSPSPVTNYCYEKLPKNEFFKKNPGYVLWATDYQPQSDCPSGHRISNYDFQKLCKSKNYLPLGVEFWQNGVAYPESAESMGTSGMMCTKKLQQYPWYSASS